MAEHHLTAQIYIDMAHPEISPDIAADGLDIVRGIYPWVKLSREVNDVYTSEDEFINAHGLRSPQLAADINIVLTRKTLVQEESWRPGKGLNLLALAGAQEYSGLAFYNNRVNSIRAALINTRATRRPDNIVAHEVGHLLGVQNKSDTQHCDKRSCLIYQWPPVHSRANKVFCDCCADQLSINAGTLAMAKRGPNPKAPNAKVF